MSTLLADIHNSSYLILLPVSLNSSSMGKNEVMCDNVRLGSGVSSLAFCAPSWGEFAVIIAKSSDNPWLVKCHPVLYSVTKCLEAEIGIVCECVPA